MYVFDSDVLIEFLRGRLPQGLELLQNTDARLVKVPAIVQAELLTGAAKSSDPARSRLCVERLLLEYEVLPFDSRCASAYARVRAALEGKGTKIGANDLLVAATALAHDATLVTNNTREYKRVKELHLMSLEVIDV